MVRPDDVGNCPQGFVRCSENTGVDTIVCINSGETDLCPINEIAFALRDEPLPAGWTELSYTNGYMLRY